MGGEGAGLLFLFVENFRFGHGPGAPEALGLGSRLFGIVDRGYAAFRKASREPPKRHRNGAKRRPDGGVLPPRTVADVDRGNVDGVTAAHGRHRNASSGTGETAAPNDPIVS